MMNKMPSLDEFLQRLGSDVKFKDSAYEVYRRVASGERHPTEPPLPDNVIILAAQAMVVLFNESKKDPPLEINPPGT